MSALQTQDGKKVFGQILAQLKRFKTDPRAAIATVEAMAAGGSAGELYDAAFNGRRLALVLPDYLEPARRHWSAAAAASAQSGRPERFQDLEKLFLEIVPETEPAITRPATGRLYEAYMAWQAGNHAAAAELARMHFSGQFVPEEIIRNGLFLMALARDAEAPELGSIVEEYCVIAATSVYRRQADKLLHEGLAEKQDVVDYLAQYEHSGKYKLTATGKKMLEEARRSVKFYAESIESQVKTMQAKTQEMRALARLTAARVLARRGENPAAVEFFYMDEACDRERRGNWLGAYRVAIEGGHATLIGAYGTVISVMRGPAGFLPGK